MYFTNSDYLPLNLLFIKKWATPASCFIFVVFKRIFYRKNCFSWDLNPDGRSIRQAHWPVDHVPPRANPLICYPIDCDNKLKIVSNWNSTDTGWQKFKPQLMPTLMHYLRCPQLVTSKRFTSSVPERAEVGNNDSSWMECSRWGFVANLVSKVLVSAKDYGVWISIWYS